MAISFCSGHKLSFLQLVVYGAKFDFTQNGSVVTFGSNSNCKCEALSRSVLVSLTMHRAQ